MAVKYSNIRKKLRMIGRMRKAQRSGKFPKRMLPARKRTYKPTGGKYYINKAISRYNSLNGEKKLIPFANYIVGPDGSWEDSITSIPLSGNIGSGTNGEVSAVLLQTGKYLTNDNVNLNISLGGVATAVGGYDIQQGSENNELDGRYGKITSSLQNIWIQMNPQNNSPSETTTYLAGMMPHEFRFIQVKVKRQNSIAPTSGPDENAATGNIANNLFINTSGKEIGLTDDMGSLEPFSFLINKSKFQVLKDYRFTLCANTYGGTLSAPLPYSSGVKQYPSSKMLKCYLPKPRGRTRWSYRDGVSVAFPQPVDFNYITQTLILCRVRGSVAGYTSDNWSVQTNGTTAVLDM